MKAEPLRLRELLERLVEAEVTFVLVGGLAVNAWGYLRATRDVDLVPDPAPDNLERLDVLLRQLGLRTGDRTLVLTDLGRIDVRQGLPQIPRYSSLDQNATAVEIDGLILRVCSLEDLLDMKRASDRPRDRDDLEALEVVRGSETPEAP